MKISTTDTFFLIKPILLKTKINFIIILCFLNLNTRAQVPTTCFEIESILVDACGSPEGENEMVRIKIGSTPLNTTNISINWPNNPWLGVCQNGATASVVASLNSTILGCGILLEPTAGVLPAGANVLIITSTAIDVTANSFTNLNDTLYVIFQCVGNTSGHFANYNTTPGLRTLSVSYSSPVNCTDTVTYDRTILVNQNGTYGGPTALKNGALANFDWSGNVTYDNQGCQAPFSPVSISANSSSPLTICPGDSIGVFALTQGGIQSVFWSGNLGSFSNPTIDTTVYFSSINDTLPFNIIVGGISNCNDTVYDTLLVNITPSVNTFITGNDTLDLCQGQNLTLIANGASNYFWSTGSSLSSINVTTGGMFVVTGSNNCFSNSDSVFVNLIIQSTIFISEPDTINICQGQSITLHANGGSSYLWSTGASTDSITVSTQGNYYVSSNGICPSNTDSVQVNVLPQINVSILEGGSTILCNGNTLTLHAIGGNNYTWNTNESTDSIVVSSIGQYIVTATNGICPSVSDTINVINDIFPSASIMGDSILCIGSSIFLSVNGVGNYSWSTGDSGNTTIISSAQQVILTATNSCNDSVFVVKDIFSEDCNINTEVLIPNVFTPNNDNSNDKFKIKGTNIKLIEGSIYNRWGNLLFEWNNINIGWNGRTYAGEIVPEGTYFYIVKITFINDKSKDFKGTVLLLK